MRASAPGAHHAAAGQHERRHDPGTADHTDNPVGWTPHHQTHPRRRPGPDVAAVHHAPGDPSAVDDRSPSGDDGPGGDNHDRTCARLPGGAHDQRVVRQPGGRRQEHVPSPDDPNRGFVSRLTVANPTGAAVDVKLSIDAATAAGFPRYLEAADLDTGALTCVTGSDMPYYKTSTTTATFVCTGSIPAKSASVITISSGSLIATSAVGQTVTIAAELAPGGANKTLQGTFAASGSAPTTTTTVAPTTTTVAPTTSTTLAPTTTTTVAHPTTTTTAVTVPASTTTTTAATGSTTSTTVAATTTTSTTLAPTTTTTTAAPTAPAVSGSLANLKAGTTYPIASPDNPDRGFVGLLTVSNPTSASKVVTVTVNATSPVAFPRYLEAADYDTGAFTCVTATNGAYYKAGSTAATFTCTGTVAANAASVITVSSGSMIPATSVGQSVTLTATVNPGAATKTLQGTYA